MRLPLSDGLKSYGNDLSDLSHANQCFEFKHFDRGKRSIGIALK